MIPYIDMRLQRWAEWSCRREDNGTGYAMSVLNRMVVISDARSDPQYDSKPLIDVSDCEAMDTERSVQTLRHELKRVVIEVYMQPGTTDQKARRLGMCKQTMYNKLDCAHLQVMNALQDNA